MWSSSLYLIFMLMQVYKQWWAPFFRIPFFPQVCFSVAAPIKFFLQRKTYVSFFKTISVLVHTKLFAFWSRVSKYWEEKYLSREYRPSALELLFCSLYLKYWKITTKTFWKIFYSFVMVFFKRFPIKVFSIIVYTLKCTLKT